MDHTGKIGRRVWGLALLASLATSGGCVGLWANLLYDGHIVKPAFEGLRGKRVAVICTDPSGDFGPDNESQMLTRFVSRNLAENVKKIEVIDRQEVDEWIDVHGTGSGRINYQEIGEGLNADLVVMVEMSDVTFYDGQTLYKGRAEIAISVYDINDDAKRVWESEPVEIAYPRQHGYQTTDMKPRKFRSMFMEELANKVARNFHHYDMKEDVAPDHAFSDYTTIR